MTADGLTSVQPQFVGSLGTYLAEAPLFFARPYTEGYEQPSAVPCSRRFQPNLGIWLLL
jgi:hypothetical protein